ncbi:MiaB/RimO family radical SAM methylthiotransferase, partial [bacterium]|nr:MiaB/RimO family radical SAM methylthiotransferase [bacterium]MBU1983217.1 MiaB/RimO family radical SAM methylthiotransferase [bacterium]
TNGYRERFLDCTAPAGPASAYLRVSDGCSHACAFCSIPRMRGFYRSEPLDRLLDQARVLAARGVKEIILIGQETTSYGVDIYGRRRIVELCSRLSDNDGLEWIRILYAHAPTISPRLVRELARVPKLVPYLDYPIEHASDRILRRMNRRVTAARMKDTIAAFRDVLPDACVRSTVLVGFPGETNEDFEKLFEFVREVRFERLGVFVYSPQEGTAGAVLDGQVEEGIALDRLDRLMNLQRAICREKHRSLVKRVLPVLVERSARGISWGRSAWDAPEIDGKVRIAGGVTPGQIVNVCVTRAHAYHVEAVVVAERNDLRERKLCGCSGRSALSRP